MSFRSSIRRRSSLLIAGSVLLAVVVGVVVLKRSPEFSYRGRAVPSGGLLLNRNGTAPTHPERAEEDLRDLHSAISQYRERFDRFPDQPRDLIAASQKGEITTVIDESKFHSGDMATSDAFDYSNKVEPNMDEYSFRYGTRRADGSRRPVKEHAGERYVWAVCETYHRANRRMLSDGRVESSPSDFYMVLWSDGKIEKLPPGCRVLVPFGQSRLTFFRGETGIPANAIPEERFWAAESSGLPPNRF